MGKESIPNGLFWAAFLRLLVLKPDVNHLSSYRVSGYKVSASPRPKQFSRCTLDLTQLSSSLLSSTNADLVS